MGQIEQAIKYFEKCLAIQQKFYGEDNNVSVAPTYSNMGLAYKAKGQTEQAIKYYEK